MRILSKSTAVVLAIVACSCGSAVPWRNEPIGEEVNLAFTLERNLVEFSTVTIDGRRGRFILGSATPRSVVDPAFVPPRSQHAMQISAKQTVALAPSRTSLGGVADAIIGAEVWADRTIAIDYRTGIVTYQKDQIEPAQMKFYRFQAEPMVEVVVDGKAINAIVDTASPDTLVLPAAQPSRGSANVRVADVNFGPVDVRYANVSHARIGNRLLQRFFVSIDYGRRLVGLWNDPRVPAS